MDHAKRQHSAWSDATSEKANLTRSSPRKVSLGTSDLELLELCLCLKIRHTGAEYIGPTTLQMSLLQSGNTKAIYRSCAHFHIPLDKL